MHTLQLSNLRFAKYKRKSSDAEDRQVLSIQSQEEHLEEIAKRAKLNVPLVFSDEGSAKIAKNREGFSNLMKAIDKKEVEAILVWKPNRLARNMLEGGLIMDLLQQGRIKAIVTPFRTYFPHDNILPLAVEFGQAKQFSSDLSDDTKRGMRTKIKEGGFCGLAPQGYLNHHDKIRERNIIIKDLERFALIRKMWKLYLSESYSIQEICDIANKRWAFKTIRRRKSGGKPMSSSSLYWIFKNPFYYGLVRCGEHQGIGNHPKMITEAEFNKVQRLLLRHGRSQNTLAKCPFTFRGVFRCKVCDCSIVAEEKRKYFCPSCKYPRTAKHTHNCPKCGKAIYQSFINQSNRYVYYSCGKKKGNCHQPCMRDTALERQVLSFLERIELDSDFVEMATKWIQSFREENKPELEAQTRLLKSEQTKLKTRLQNLLDMRLDGEIGLDEYKTEKKRLEVRIDELKVSLKHFSNSDQRWDKALENELSYCQNLVDKFKKVSNKDKRICIKKICPNPTIMEGKAFLKAESLYIYLKDEKPPKNTWFEPPKSSSTTSQTATQKEATLAWGRWLTSVRTLIYPNP